MGSTESGLLEEPLTPADAEATLPLSAEAGWNQTAADWGFMLGEGRGIGVRDGSGRWIGSALALPLGARLSWISMVLVARDARRRGLGTRLLRRTIETVREAGRVAGLDATELGRPVYLRLGFRDLYTVSRLRLEAPVPAEAAPLACTIRPLMPAELPGIVAFDAPRSGMQRSHVLAHLLGEAPEHALIAEADGRVVGFVLRRPGRTAFQVGPVIADAEAVALALVSAVLRRLGGPVMIDVPDAHLGLRAWLERAGAVRERGFTRMTLGVPPAGLRSPAAVFALAGPELG
jgi:GNAT superfamily N-acetyltransferase